MLAKEEEEISHDVGPHAGGVVVLFMIRLLTERVDTVLYVFSDLIADLHAHHQFIWEGFAERDGETAKSTANVDDLGDNRGSIFVCKAREVLR